MNYAVSLLVLFVFLGCSNVKTDVKQESIVKKLPLKLDENLSCEELVAITPKKEHIEIDDLVNISQDVNYYTSKMNDEATLFDVQKKYEKYYFNIWNIDKPMESLNDVKWPFASYCVGRSYGENLQLLEKGFFDEMLDEANFKSFSTINSRAITLKDTNIRAFPTIRPLLMDPTLAGEGFPFDYLQNSTVHANKPIFVSHYSKDREWAYIFTSFTSGWIRSDEFVYINKKESDLWQRAQQVKIVKEGVPIYDENKNFLFNSKIGMMFALVSEDDRTYTVLTISTYKNSKPLYLKSKISKDIAYEGTLEFSKKNLNAIIKEAVKTNYGWGGMYGQRDCSSMLRDIYGPFGIWLPRNSYQQSKKGEVISLEKLSDKEKIELIKERAVPFQTLLYKKGHIVLYVGTYNDEIIIFHNTWGIKTKEDDKEGRIVIGRPVFSTLELGKNQKGYDEEAGILRNLKSMNIITR